MSLTAKVVEGLLVVFDRHPDAIGRYPDVYAYLKDWIIDGSDVVAGVVVRSQLFVEKSDTENLIIFMTAEGPVGWLIGKDAKKEEWEKQFPGAKDKVWVIPPGHSVLRPMSGSLAGVLDYMKMYLKLHPAPPKHIPLPPNPTSVDVEPSKVETVPKEPVQGVLPLEEIPPDLIEAAAAELRAKEAGEPEIPIKKRRVKLYNVKKKDIIKKPKVPKAAKVKPDRSLRAIFRSHLASINIEALKKPWMSTKDIRLVDTPEALQAWVDGVLADPSRWRKDVLGELVPIIAVDTETIGLDNRIIIYTSEDGSLVYDVKAEIAGLCLASHADEGVYVPIHHVSGICMKREDVARILQPLFNRSHLIFYNAKFDREVLRICLDITVRPFPHFEDVQVLQYDNDPKANMDEKGKGKKAFNISDIGGLKALSESILGLEQIKLEQLVKVTAIQKDSVVCECKHVLSQHDGKCTDEGCPCVMFKGKESMRVQHAPFNWLPTNVALWYAAADATCTWGLWDKVLYPARNRKVIHKIDHLLVDSITWIERQRFLIDTERHAQTVKWHQGKLRLMEKNLQDMAVGFGWPTKKDEDGNTLEQSIFNVNSNPQIGQLLFDIRGMKSVRTTPGGKASVDAVAMEDLANLYPDDPFLTEYALYKSYVALHPDNLRFDPADHSARVYFRQNVVAGGRLSAQGGDFDVDGGFGLNPQGIKKPEGNWSVYGKILTPDFVPEADVEPHEESELHKSCFRSGKLAKGIIKNHIANYLGYSICLVPTCTTCVTKFGVLIEDGHLDSNEVLNVRCLFVAPPGWTLFSVDYSNIEMRAAANCSGEPEFIKEFLEGEGDFHSLTASKVFPEFNDPNTSKEVRKTLRAAAKIINFALLYGGTEYTIYDNMVKLDPTMTRDRAREMVKKYWEGVPVFNQYCEDRKKEARDGPLPSLEPKWEPNKVYYHGDMVQFDPSGRYENGKDHAVYVCLHRGLQGMKGGDSPVNGNPNWIKSMRCVTAIGRIVSFVSAMEAQGIHYPLPEENTNYMQYRKYNDNAEIACMEGDKKAEKEWQALAQQLWLNKDTGVKNVIDWKKFFGKIQRVAVNTPLQGLAGDFMRMSLNKVCEFAAIREPLVQSIFRLHATIHDEIDFIVKNEYVPYILPRITRLMKLRRLHAVKKWPVPIECDIEYGHSWDVDTHATGSKDHAPMAWTKIKGLENYVPEEYLPSMKPLLAAIESNDDARIAKANEWFLANINKQAHNAVKLIFKATDHKSRVRAMIITFQLHEYWTVDATPDEKETELETFTAWESRAGLGPDDRDPKYPSFGYLGAIPFGENVIRPILTTWEINPTEAIQGVPAVEVVPEVQTPELAVPKPPEAQQTPTQVVQPSISPILRTLSPEDVSRLYNSLGKDKGHLDVSVTYTINGKPKVGIIKNCLTVVIPDEFLDKILC